MKKIETLQLGEDLITADNIQVIRKNEFWPIYRTISITFCSGETRWTDTFYNVTDEQFKNLHDRLNQEVSQPEERSFSKEELECINRIIPNAGSSEESLLMYHSLREKIDRLLSLEDKSNEKIV